MPRKTFENQAGYSFGNRGHSYSLNQVVKSCKRYPNQRERYDECWAAIGFYPRNPDMKPLLRNGRKP